MNKKNFWSELDDTKENHLGTSIVFKPETDKMAIAQFEMSYKNCMLIISQIMQKMDSLLENHQHHFMDS